MGACHRRPLSLLSVRRGWAIGSPVIVDEAVEMELGFSPRDDVREETCYFPPLGVYSFL